MKTLVALLLTIVFSVNLLAGTRDPSIPDEKYIEYAKQFKYVYKVCGTSKDGELFCASSVVIDPHWILTAAHVVKNQRTCLIHKGDKEKAHIVSEIFCHEDFCDEKFGMADIALMYTEDDIGLDFYPPLYETDDEVGKVCSMAGYGLHGTFITGVKNFDQNMRAGSNVVDKIEKNLLICSPSIKDRKTELEYLICSGDSGGGLFIDGKLAGINCCVFGGSDNKPDSTYGDESGHTRISKLISWIKTTMKKKKRVLDKPF